MQINLTANPTNPAGETNTKSAEIPEAGTANAFSCQMGEILNQRKEDGNPRADAVPPAQISHSRRTDPEDLSQGALSLLPQCPNTEENLAQNLQKENPPKMRWSMIPDESGSAINLRGTGKEFAGTVLQDKAPSAQLNLDFPAPEASESHREIPGQAAGSAGTQERSLRENLEFSENRKSQNDAAPVPISKISLKIPQASLENADTANVSMGQGQTADQSGSWTAMQNRAKQGHFNPGRPQLPPAGQELQQMQPVIASSAALNGEVSLSARSTPAKLPTSNEPENIFQLADQIRIQLRDGKGEIRIRLKPDSLGRLEIRAESTANGVSARISTESDTVKSYLENNLHLLHQTLQDQGLKIDRIHIVVQDALDSRSSSGQTAQFGHAGSGQNGKEPQFSSGKSGSPNLNPLDEAALDAASWLALNPNNRFYTVA